MDDVLLEIVERCERIPISRSALRKRRGTMTRSVNTHLYVLSENKMFKVYMLHVLGFPDLTDFVN